jgi:hypothetical protein
MGRSPPIRPGTRKRDDQLSGTYERYRRYRKTPRGKFVRHKLNAAFRGIPFNLTFEQWWSIWEKSGKWEQRGNKKGQYCMARYGDIGGYEAGNVRIEKLETNVAERNRTVKDKMKKGLKITKSVESEEAPF